jgi:hypothetical protein
MTRHRDPHPLSDALIQPAPQAVQLDPASRRIHERLGEHPHDRALPSGRAAEAHPRWKWGRRADRPTDSGPPLIMSPTDLLPGGGQADAPRPSIDDVRRRLRP